MERKSTFYELSIKKSDRRGLWQFKDGDHQLFPLHGFQFAFDEIIESLGCDSNDRDATYLMTFGSGELPGWQLKLRKDGTDVEVVDFSVVENRSGKSGGRGWLPKEIFAKLEGAPECLHLRITERIGDSIVFLRETRE